MFDISVKAGLSNDIEIWLKLEGEDPFEDVFPVFCDSLVAPVIVDDQDTIGAMSSSLTDIVDKLGSGRRPNDNDDYEESPLLSNTGNFNF
ncbi:hypothetical protein D3C86_2071150 [compost metagenome]